jgi:hypothetical protein
LGKDEDGIWVEAHVVIPEEDGRESAEFLNDLTQVEFENLS